MELYLLKWSFLTDDVSDTRPASALAIVVPVGAVCVSAQHACNKPVRTDARDVESNPGGAALRLLQTARRTAFVVAIQRARS
jgi:hypothetical protein